MFQTLAPTLDAPPADPVAFCGMPAGQLPLRDRASHTAFAALDDDAPASPGLESSSPGQSASDAAPRLDGPTAAGTMPLRDRIWHLFCSGASYSAIAQQLHLDRQTVTRHVRAVQQMLAADERESLALARMRAVEAQFQILAATWDAYHAECQREDDYYDSLASQPPAPRPVAPERSREKRKPYRAHRARLLSLASTVARTAARLEGLFDRSVILAADAETDAPSPCPDPAPSFAPQGPTTPSNEDPVAFCGMPDSPLPPAPSIFPSAASASPAVLSSSPLMPSASSAVSPPLTPPLASAPAHPSLARQPRSSSVTLAPATSTPASARPLSRLSPVRPGLRSRAAPPRTARQRSSALTTTRSSA